MLPRRICVVLRALMALCGFCDGSGEFALRVKIPAKSVVGRIMAAALDKMEIEVVGLSLDVKGNSIGGIAVLEELPEKLELRFPRHS